MTLPAPKCTGVPLDRRFWLAILIAALVVIPRSLLITAAHSPTMDEQAHLRYGLSHLTGNPSGLIHASADTSLGQEIVAFPMLVTGCLPAKPMNPATLSPRPLASEDPSARSENSSPQRAQFMQRLRAARHDVLFGHHFSPDFIRLLISAWKSLLFLPAAGLVFHWARWLYGLSAGWLALALLLVDPTFAAHIPLATTDMSAVEGILFACFFAWRAMESPRRFRSLLLAAAFIAAALLMKLTATILPVVVIAIAFLFAARRDRFTQPAMRRRFHSVLIGALLTCLFLWAFTGFDFSNPGPWIDSPSKSHSFSLYGNLVYPLLQHPLPAGDYIQVFVNGMGYNASMRWAYLLGHANHGGWWYYFPVVALYKIPLGYFLIFAVALLSLIKTPPRFNEFSLLLPLAGWLLMLLFLSHINTGFRHFLPAYIFILILASRSLTSATRPRLLLLWLAVAFSFAHTLTFHPDYLSYFNRPIDKPWLICNDSNIDWGQGLKEVRAYLDAHPTSRPVYLRYDWDSVWADYYLGQRVHRLKLFEPPPASGLLIISPVWEAGYWDPTDAYAFLRPAHPIALIGHAMPVYDLDALHPQPSPQ